MKYLPISLSISGKNILIVGGGKTALQKIKAIRRFSRSVTVVSPEILREIRLGGYLCKIKAYSPKDLNGIFIVYACTNDSGLNARIRSDALKKSILVNVVDDPENCDFISPAIYKKGYMTVAVSSNGKNVKRSVTWRDRIKSVFEK